MTFKKILSYWQALSERYGGRRTRTLLTLLVTGFVALFIHLLFIGGLGHSALLYMLVPFFLSVLIAAVRPYGDSRSIWGDYFKHLTTASMVFLATSIILREGFICILFFFPIYVFFVTLSYLIRAYLSKRSSKSNRLYSIIIPIIVLLMSLEGTSDSLSFSRDTHIEVIRVTSLSVDQVKRNLARSIDLDTDRHWLLAIFPMPYHIDAGSLKAGDVHKIKTRYQRWFFTNTHEGVAELLIKNVAENEIQTEFLSDTTYFSSYLKTYGTRITFRALDTGETEITLRIDYQRRLDPAWYFHPLQKFGVSKMAAFLIEEVMIRA